MKVFHKLFLLGVVLTLVLVACGDNNDPASDVVIIDGSNASAIAVTIPFGPDGVFHGVEAAEDDVLVVVHEDENSVTVGAVNPTGGSVNSLTLSFSGAAGEPEVDAADVTNQSSALEPQASTLSYINSDIVNSLAQYRLGDINKDGSNTIGDIAQMAGINSSSDASEQVLADFDGNKVINNADFLLALEKFVNPTFDPNIVVHPKSATINAGDSLDILIFNQGSNLAAAPIVAGGTLVQQTPGQSYAYSVTPAATGPINVNGGIAGSADVLVTVDSSGGGGGNNNDVCPRDGGISLTAQGSSDKLLTIEQNVNGDPEKICYAKGNVVVGTDASAGDSVVPAAVLTGIVEIFIGRTESDTSLKVYDDSIANLAANPFVINTSELPQGEITWVIMRFFYDDGTSETRATMIIPDNEGPQLPDIFDVSEITPAQTLLYGNWARDDFELRLEDILTLVDNPTSTTFPASGTDEIVYCADSTPFNATFNCDVELGRSKFNPYLVTFDSDGIADDTNDVGNGLPNGTYRIWANAIDQLGNRSFEEGLDNVGKQPLAISSFILNIDNIQPIITNKFIVDRGIGDVDSYPGNDCTLLNAAGQLPIVDLANQTYTPGVTNGGSVDPANLDIWIDAFRADFGWVSGCAYIGFEAFDPNFGISASGGPGGPLNIDYTFGDANQTVLTPPAPSPFVLDDIVDVNTFGEGPITLDVVARDLLGHETKMISDTAWIDNTPPHNLQFTSPSLVAGGGGFDEIYTAWDQVRVAAKADDNSEDQNVYPNANGGIRRTTIRYAYLESLANPQSEAAFVSGNNPPFPYSGIAADAATDPPVLAADIGPFNYAIELFTQNSDSVAEELRLPSPSNVFSNGAIPRDRLALITTPHDRAGNARAAYAKLRVNTVSSVPFNFGHPRTDVSDAALAGNPAPFEIMARQFDDFGVLGPYIHHHDINLFPSLVSPNPANWRFEADTFPDTNVEEQISFFHSKPTRPILGYPFLGSLDTAVPDNDKYIDLNGELIGSVENAPYRQTYVDTEINDEYYFALRYNNRGHTAIAYPTNRP